MKLRTRVTTLFFLQTIAIAAYIFFYWQPNYIAHIEKRETASERNTLRLIVPAIIEPLLKGELSQVYEMLDEQSAIQRNWAKIELVNQQGIQIYPLSEFQRKTSQSPGDNIYLRQDVISGEDKIATLGVELDLSSIVREESDYLNSLLWLLFFGLVISAIVLGYFLDYSIGKPIQMLASAAEKLKKGEFSVSIPQSEHRRDEINTLLSSFSEMRDSLKTSQSKLEANASRLKAVLDTVNDGILMIDKNGIMLSVNHSMFTLFGYTEDELLGQSVNILMEPKQAAKHDQILTELTKMNGPLELGRDRKMHAVRKNGESFPIELNISEVWHSNQKKYVATIRDITERLKIDRLKNEFVSTVSHELRTPITSIKGSIDLMVAGVVGNVSDKALDLLHIAKSNSTRLLLLINDILDIEKIETGEIELSMSENSVFDILSASVNANASYAEMHLVQLQLIHPGEDIRFYADINRVLQVMSNLISNACKFSNGSPIVEIGSDFDGRKVRLYVRDHGAGIPDEFRARIFSKFAQADGSDTRKVGGSGLGLFISKQLIEKMQGSIGYETSPGKGSTFYCEFDARIVPEKTLSQRTAS